MLDPKEEARFADLKAMCRELHVPAPPEIMIGLRVHDRNGLLIFDDIQRGHSWTRNFYNMLFAFASRPVGAGTTFGAGYLATKNVPGSVGCTLSINFPSGRAITIVPGDVSSSAYGLLVGTSDTAFSVDQFALQAPIVQGVGAGQFSYAAGVADAGAYTAGTKTWKTTLYRVMNNNSGGSVTVKEVALYAFETWISAPSITMFERSVLSPTVAVANGAQLTVTYEISMDFSAID